MSPESHASTLLGELPSRLDAETLFMSGGFERLEGFQRIIEFGEQALPELLLDMDQPAWWRMQAIWTIADSIGEPIEFAEEIRGRYLSVRDQIITWAEANGYKHDRPKIRE